MLQLQHQYRKAFSLERRSSHGFVLLVRQCLAYPRGGDEGVFGVFVPGSV